MKKVGVLVLAILFAMIPFVLADNHTEDEKSGIERGFECLEDKAGTCTSMTTQELALTILATPDNVFDDCVNELNNRERQNNWGNVRDTALAILAMKHAGKDTTAYEDWLLEQEEIPNDLIWYIQQDSDGPSVCDIAYNTNNYRIEVGENKKIDTPAGECLSLAQYNFWLEVDDKCYENEISFQCDNDFILNLLYKNRASSTIYVLEGTMSSPSYETLTTSVVSKCFGSGTCDYEGTVWAALALSEAGRNIDQYIPYIVAMSDSNKNVLPNSFIFMLTNYQDYANKLVNDQRKPSDYWEATSTKYNKYYDTALAILALKDSSADLSDEARGWLLFSQSPSNGCWGNSIVNTAAVLWALEGRASKTGGGGGSSVTHCKEAGYFCIPNEECPNDQLLGNFHCSSLSSTCCETENLKNCNEYTGGTVCDDGMYCSGLSRNALDGKCCLATCEDTPQGSECENEGYGCYDSCLASEEEKNYECTGEQVCCGSSFAPTPEKKNSLWWLWVLLGILIIGAVLAIVYKDKLKEKLGGGKKKPGPPRGQPRGGMPPRRPGMPPGRPGMPPRGAPPRPGFPPVVRPQQAQARRPMPKYKEDPAMKETFRKLRKIATR